MRIGSHRFLCEHEPTAERTSRSTCARKTCWPGRSARRGQRVRGAIEKIEFLGSYCLVRVNAQAIAPDPLTVYLSLNFLAEQALEVGSRLPLKLLPERMRFF